MRILFEFFLRFQIAGNYNNLSTLNSAKATNIYSLIIAN